MSHIFGQGVWANKWPTMVEAAPPEPENLVNKERNRTTPHKHPAAAAALSPHVISERRDHSIRFNLRMEVVVVVLRAGGVSVDSPARGVVPGSPVEMAWKQPGVRSLVNIVRTVVNERMHLQERGQRSKSRSRSKRRRSSSSSRKINDGHP